MKKRKGSDAVSPESQVQSPGVAGEDKRPRTAFSAEQLAKLKVKSQSSSLVIQREKKTKRENLNRMSPTLNFVAMCQKNILPNAYTLHGWIQLSPCKSNNPECCKNFSNNASKLKTSFFVYMRNKFQSK